MRAHAIRVAALLLLSMFVTDRSSNAGENPVTFSFNSDWPPYSFGVGDKVDGILPRLMSEIIEKHMGTPILRKGSPWVRAQQEVKSGRLNALVTTPTKQRLGYLRRSKNVVYTFQMRALVKTGSRAEAGLLDDPTMKGLERYRACNIKGDGWATAFYSHSNVKFIEASKILACLRMVARGRADFIIGNPAVMMYTASTEGLNDQLSILPEVYDQMQFTLLIDKNSDKAGNFLQRFDETVTNLKDDGSYDIIVQKALRKFVKITP